MIWIFDCWTESEKNICTSCIKNGKENIVMVLHDDGFLPAGVMSPYRFLAQECIREQRAENSLFADLLEVPDLWEIRMHYDRAEIWDEGIKKAEIDYAEPIRSHNVGIVRWMTPEGLVYKRDFYDKYGKLYYADLLDVESHTDVRTYYAEKKPLLIYQPDFDTYTLFREGKLYKVYDSTQNFLSWFLRYYFPQENGIISNDIKILEMVSEVGGPPCNFGCDALILTNSDQIEHLEELIRALPMLHFHIGAKTLMSDKLLSLKQYLNVTLYQGISEQKRVELLMNCTYYLDINHYQEICNIVYEAYRYNLLITGFDTTIHNSSCILRECIFETEDVEGMIYFLNNMHKNSEALKSVIMRQSKLL